MLNSGAANLQRSDCHVTLHLGVMVREDHKMADETSELEIAGLKRRVSLIESEMRVFTPPVSRIERDLWEFRAEFNQKLDASNQRMDRWFTELNRRFDDFRREFDASRKEFRDFRDQLLVLLREIVDKKS